jgi:hypothetical protein
MAKKTRRAPVVPAVQEPVREGAAPAIVKGPLAYVLASLALLIPCFWQSRLQAGDLSSHLYNAWLAQLIERGQAPGLKIAFQTTNVLFDLLLKWLLGAVGAAAAQRIAVGLCVLVFVWGAFAFISKVSGRPAWRMMPWITVLAYGWVFHIGFFNFYLSLGICFWALALAWDFQARGLAIAAGLLMPAYLAHALPVFWTAGAAVYLAVARRVTGVRVLAAFLAGIVALRVLIPVLIETLWFSEQLKCITGFDQAWVYNGKYLFVSVMALAMAAVWIVRGVPTRDSKIFQLYLLTAASIAIVPGWVLIPGYKHALVYIAERMSLAASVCVLAWLAAAAPRAWDRYAAFAAAAVFFSMLYVDEAKLNSLEDQMAAAVAQLPPMQRVIIGIDVGDQRINAVTHMIDRVCVGRCYSYANYEPSTAQFRVRAVAPNAIVVADNQDSSGLQTGRYIVQERDLPMYQLLLDERGAFQVRVPPVGQPSGVTAWSGF